MRAEVIHGDCLAVMPTLTAGSIDLVLADLPYGTTQCKWDAVIPFAPLWAEYRRLLKPTGCVVLTAAQPFTSALVMSNPREFSYAWTWNKVNRITGHLNAKRQPLRVTEDVVVFARNGATYNPQMIEGAPYRATSRGRKSSCYGTQSDGVVTVNTGQHYPRNLISIAADERGTVGRIHPTQKPVALMDYLIRTHSNTGDLVLDNTAGSGTTGVACVLTDRRFILIEERADYCAIARQRIADAQAQTSLEIPA